MKQYKSTLEELLAVIQGKGGSDTICHEGVIYTATTGREIQSIFLIAATTISQLKYFGESTDATGINYITEADELPAGTTIFFKKPVIEITASTAVLATFYEATV